MRLSPENYKTGFLVDEAWMGGVAEDPKNPGTFLAYIVDLGTAESLGAHRFPTVETAIAALESIPRSWRFESTKSCGESGCEKGGCGGCSKNSTPQCTKIQKTLGCASS
jgi:hypothetical protein